MSKQLKYLSRTHQNPTSYWYKFVVVHIGPTWSHMVPPLVILGFGIAITALASSGHFELAMERLVEMVRFGFDAAAWTFLALLDVVKVATGNS